MIALPRIYLGKNYFTDKNRNTLRKLLTDGKNRGKYILLSWINIKCDWCKKFISRKRLKHKTTDSLVLCERCAKKHYEEYKDKYNKEYWKDNSEMINAYKRLKRKEEN